MTASVRLRLVVLALASAAAPGALAAPARGVTSSEIIVGMTAGFTGTSRELAQSMKVGLEVAFAEANAAGGVHGRKLRLIGTDHVNNPVKAVELAKELVEQRNVLLLFGNTGSGSIERQLPYLLQQRVILFGTVSGGNFLYNEPSDRYVFNFRPSYAEEVQQVVRYLLASQGFKPAQLAFFGQKDAFGDSCWTGFSKSLRRNGGDPNRAIRVGYHLNTIDVDQAVNAIRANGSRLRAVVTCGTHKQVAALISKLRDLRLTYTAVSAVEANALAEDLGQLGPGYAQSVLATQVVPMPTSSATAVMRYREQLQRHAPSARPDFMSLQSYLSALLLIQGLHRAGPDLTTEKLVEALEEIRNWDMGLGTPISLGVSQHTASRKVWGTLLTPEGTFQSVDLEVD